MGLYDDNDIDRVREAVDIAEVIGRYVQLKRKTQGDYWGLCPFHSEKTGSFHVRTDRGMFHCFGCGKGGNVFTFLMEMEGISFGEALRSLAERAGIQLTPRPGQDATERDKSDNDRLFAANGFAVKHYHANLTGKSPSPGAAMALAYLKGRGINDPLIRKFQLGWAENSFDALLNAAAPNGLDAALLFRAGLAQRRRDESGYFDRFRARIMFPIQNLSDKTVAFGGRRLDGVTDEADQAKYINTGDTPVYSKGRVLYSLNLARAEARKAGFIYLVEGYTDLLALAMAGFGNVAASLGTALTNDQAALLRRFVRQVHVVYDADTAGIEAGMRAADLLTLAGLETRLIALPEGDDPDSLFRRGGLELLGEHLEQHKSFVEFRLGAAGMGADTPLAQRVESARGLLEVIRNVRDPLQSDLLMSELSALSGIRREALDKAASGVRRRTSPADDAVAGAGQFAIKAPSAERQLLMALLSHPRLVALTMKFETANYLSDLSLRELYRQIERAHLQGKNFDPVADLQNLDEPDLQAFVAKAVLSDLYDALTAEVDIRKCMQILSLDPLTRRKHEIEAMIANPSSTSDQKHELKTEMLKIDKLIFELKSQTPVHNPQLG